MNNILLFRGSARESAINQFQIDYPYYGLFGTANVTPLQEEGELLYRCRLLNGSILTLKKSDSKKWIDASLNLVTPLASVIGNCIDDFMKRIS